MTRANRQPQPIRPAAVAAVEEHAIPLGHFLVNIEHAAIFADLEGISAARPELAAVMNDLLSVALQLTLMLPRPALERFVEGVIERLDELDGDSDLEPIDEREPDW